MQLIKDRLRGFAKRFSEEDSATVEEAVNQDRSKVLVVKEKGIGSSWIASPWLPIKYRIEFKILLITFKIHNFLAPTYLSSLISLRLLSHLNII